MLEGVKRRTSMCQAYYRTSYIRERNIVPVSSNFLTQISCGIKTKCRKTRAMQRDFTIVDSLALRQCNTSMIPDTHLLKLLFLARYTPRSICILLISISVVLWICCLDAPAYDSGHSFAKIAIPCTILSLAQFVSFIYLTISFCRHTSWMYLSTIYYIYILSLRRIFFPSFP